MKIEQNKNYSVIIAIAIIAIIISLFGNSDLVFADTDGLLPIITETYSSSYTSPALSVFHDQYGYSKYGSFLPDTYACYISNGTEYAICVYRSPDADEIYISGWYDAISGSDNYYGTFNWQGSVHIGSYGNYSNFTFDVPVFDSEEEFYQYYESKFSHSSLNYSLPPGNVAFIEVASDNSFSLSTQFVEATGLFSGVFSKTSQTWGWSDTIVSSSTFPLSGHSLIPWAKGENTNLFGQSHFGTASSASLSGSGKYLVIYNPLYSFQTDQESNFEHNFNVSINCTAVKSITVVSLKGTLGTGIESSWTLTSTPDGEVYTGEIDSETGVPTFTDSSGNSGSPVYGGDNYIEESTQNFKGWLNGIVQSFLGVLNSGRDAILQLVSGAASFFSVFPSLYNWLPSPVLSVLTSAIVLALAIGLIKVLL